jgi:hypothetical protein
MHLANAMKDQPSCVHSGEVHAAEAHTHARSAVIGIHNLIGRQGDSESILEEDERTWRAILYNRQALGEVLFSIQACSGNERDQQRDLAHQHLGFVIKQRRDNVGAVAEECDRDPPSGPTYSELSARRTSIWRSLPSRETRTRHGLQHTSQS